MSLTREQFFAKAHKANNASPDWRRWSLNKWQSERHRVPEINAILTKCDAQLAENTEAHTKVMRMVDPGYDPESPKVYSEAVFAMLAHRFNMTPQAVGDLEDNREFLGLVRAYILIQRQNQTPPPPAPVKTLLSPLNGRAKKIADIITNTPGLLGKDIAAKLRMGADDVRGIIKRDLVPRGFTNARNGSGYYPPASV